MHAGNFWLANHFCFVCEKRKCVIKFGRKVIVLYVNVLVGKCSSKLLKRHKLFPNGTHTVQCTLADGCWGRRCYGTEIILLMLMHENDDAIQKWYICCMWNIKGKNGIKLNYSGGCDTESQGQVWVNGVLCIIRENVVTVAIKVALRMWIIL